MAGAVIGVPGGSSARAGGSAPRGAGGAGTARRLRAPSWKDPRLAAGLLLVAGAVVAGGRVVAAADETVPVYAAAGALTPGQAISADDLQVVRLRLDGGGGAGAYVSAAEPPGQDVVALRGVGAGELVPAAALGTSDDVDVRPVGVPVTGSLPSDVVPGAHVDVWVSAPDPQTTGAFLPPERVVEAAAVAEVDAAEGALGAASGTTVQVLVPTAELPDVLAALAADARIALVLSPGEEGAGGSGG